MQDLIEANTKSNSDEDDEGSEPTEENNLDQGGDEDTWTKMQGLETVNVDIMEYLRSLVAGSTPSVHTHDDLVVLAARYDDESCPPCMDVSGVALLRPSLIQHYTYGERQCTLEVQECLDGNLKLLRLDPSISLI